RLYGHHLDRGAIDPMSDTTNTADTAESPRPPHERCEPAIGPNKTENDHAAAHQSEAALGAHHAAAEAKARELAAWATRETQTPTNDAAPASSEHVINPEAE